ncbi:trypsin-like serine protease [Roseibium salinum]|nr:trypsin-like serine protease [Roseibium salinum]
MAILALSVSALAPSISRAAELEVIDSTQAPWPSIGRVNVAGFRSTSMCTGTLIAPTVVLTAAHCLHDLRTLKPFPADDVLFFSPGFGGTSTRHGWKRPVSGLPRDLLL